MREPLFDLSAEYEQMLNQGIRLSGGDRHFFSDRARTVFNGNFADGLPTETNS